jgi:cyclopropane-fatty-acyl-phospholipid synthase
MATTVSPPDAPGTTAALELLQTLLADIRPPVAVRLWDGSTTLPAADPALTIVVRRPAALWRLIAGGNEAALADVHLRGDIDLEGDIFAVLPVARALLNRPNRGLGERARLALGAARVLRARPAAPSGGTGTGPRRWASLRGRRHSEDRDSAAVRHHYDVSNRFYSLFLDPAMVYSCAVFAHADEDLAGAQLRKLDLICRKLRLRPGERLLDIGCGWGSLMLHAAREYGVEADGITLSERQAELARERIAAAGLADRCRVHLVDYRSFEGAGSFDKISSVGMFEHVGRARAADYFRNVHRLLRPGGAYLHHAIAGDPRVPHRYAPSLANLYVFPDHELVPVGDTIASAELIGLELRDVENLREHYALTLRRWVATLEARHAETAAEVGEATWRAWRLVFAGAAFNFENGRHRLVQALFVKPDAAGRVGLPLERRDWYE